METLISIFGISQTTSLVQGSGQLPRQAHAQIRRAIQSRQVYRALNSTTSATPRKTTQNRSTGRPETNLSQRDPGINTTEARCPRRSCGYRSVSYKQFTRQANEKGANAESVRAT